MIDKDAAKQNAELIESELEKLKSGHWNMFQRKYREFKAHSEEIVNLFKTLKPLFHNDRERLWEEFREIRDEVHREHTRELESFAEASSSNKELILYDIRQAHYYAYGASNKTDIDDAVGHITSALERMKDKASCKLTKSDSQECWDSYKEVNQEIRDKRNFLFEIEYERLRNEAYSEIFPIIDSNPKDAGQRLKELKGDVGRSRYRGEKSRHRLIYKM